MFDLPFKLFPPALLTGAILYGLVCMLWLQPLVETRMAAKILIPQCEVGLRRMEASTPVPQNDKRLELEMLISMYKQSGLDQIPYMKEIIQMTRRKLDAMQPTRLRISSRERDSICSCSVDKAYENAHFSMTLHVASLRTHYPASIKNIGQSILTVVGSGICGPLPWVK